MNKNYVFSIFLVVTMCFSTVAGAATTMVGAISAMVASPSNTSFVDVYMTPGLTFTGTRPSCATPGVNRYELDITTSTGQNLFRILNAAELAGTQITIYGTGTCSVVPSAENISGVAF